VVRNGDRDDRQSLSQPGARQSSAALSAANDDVQIIWWLAKITTASCDPIPRHFAVVLNEIALHLRHAIQRYTPVEHNHLVVIARVRV